MSKENSTPLNRNFFCVVYALAVIMVFVMSGNCFAGPIIRVKVYPEHVGVFTTVGIQQFIAFGFDAAGKSTNITRKVDWISSNKHLVTINETGLATIATGRTSGQVKITCSYPKKKTSPPLAIPLLLLNDREKGVKN